MRRMHSWPNLTRGAAALTLACFGAWLPTQALAVVAADSPSAHVLLPGDFGGVADANAKLLVTSVNGNTVCSGTLLAGGEYVLTAAHCAAGFTSLSVDFKLGTVIRSVSVGNAFVHPGWNNILGNGSDIALLKLDAPVTDIAGLRISTHNEVGHDILAFGYGLVGSGATGATHYDEDPPGTVPRVLRPHWGRNTIDTTDFILVEAVLGAGQGDHQYGETYVQDFDDGSPGRNALQRLKDDNFGSWADSSLGLGADESLVAGGDSGGADLVWEGFEYLLAGVHSYTWDLCGYLPGCDALAGTNSSFGDLSGATAVFSHVDFIAGIAGLGVLPGNRVPEPAPWALLGLALLGLALLGSHASPSKHRADRLA